MGGGSSADLGRSLLTRAIQDLVIFRSFLLLAISTEYVHRHDFNPFGSPEAYLAGIFVVLHVKTQIIWFSLPVAKLLILAHFGHPEKATFFPLL